MTETSTTFESDVSNTEFEHPATTSTLMVRLMGIGLLVAFVGWLDTSFLAGIHYGILPLPDGAPVEGTGWAVLTSEWSYLMGVPTAVYGGIYYLVVLTLSLLWLTDRLPHIERLLLPVTTVGIIASAMFVYLQLFVIEAICPFCMISAGTTTILFFIGIGVYLTSDAPPLRQLGFEALDREAFVWPVALLVVGITLVGMIHLATVAPIPVPGA